MRDTVTVQAYHKLITRLVLDGRLVEVDDPDADAQRYALAPALHADTALTLDDIDLIAFELKPTEAIAALIDAREIGRGQPQDRAAAGGDGACRRCRPATWCGT